MRAKLRQMRQKSKYNEELEEKTCKNCSRQYYELENYNWSCKTHYGSYSGQLW